MKDVVLRLPNLMISAIVDDKDADGQTVRHDCLQLLQIHHDAAVAFDADHLPVPACQTRPNGSGQGVAHRRDGTVHEESAPCIDIV